MSSDYSRIILEALKITHYSGPKDNQRFRAALQDLAGKFPQDRRFLDCCGEDELLLICSRAARAGSAAELENIRREASQFLQSERMLSADWAQLITDTLTDAMILYAGKPLPERGGAAPNPKSGKKKGVAIGVFLVILFLVAGVLGYVFTSTKAEKEQRTAESSQHSDRDQEQPPAEIPLKDQVELLSWDVNYSSCWKYGLSFRDDGVETLLLVKNSSDKPIGEYQFTFRDDQAKEVKNAEETDSPFKARGYVPPQSLGYMFARMYMPENTPHDQGKITCTDVIQCDEHTGDVYPRVSDLHWQRCSRQERKVGGGSEFFEVNEWNFSCRLTNTWDEKINRNTSIMVAAPRLSEMDQKYGDTVFGRWGCGPLPEDMEPGGSLRIDEGLKYPQFEEANGLFDTGSFGVYVIDLEP